MIPAEVFFGVLCAVFLKTMCTKIGCIKQSLDFFFSKKVFKNPYFAEYLQIVASESVNIKCIFSFLTGHSLESKGSTRYYSKRTHLDMFRSHLSLSNTKVLKKKGTFFINITMDSIRKPEAN